jgi:hypothetical protein
VNAYDPDTDGVLMEAGEVCNLLHVSRAHLPNLRADGTLRGFQLTPKGNWKYPSQQPTLRAAREALHTAAEAP